MAAPNIELSYNRIEQMVNDANGVISGGMSEAISAYGSICGGLSKSSGETLDAIRNQISAEQELASAMSGVCTQFVKSISNAAESLSGLDGSMAGSIGLD